MSIAPSTPTESIVVSPARLQPGPIRTVGAGSAASAPGSGNQCALMTVPSKETTSTSTSEPATGVTSTGVVVAGGSQASATTVVDAAAASVVVVAPESPASEP